MFEIAKTVAFWIVFAVGIGGIGWLGFYVYDQLFTYAMTYFGIKRDLIEFMWNKRSKRQGPKRMSDEEAAELKRQYTRN